MIRLLQKLFRYLLTGTFFLLPFIITVGAVAWLGFFIADYLGPNTLIGEWLGKIGLFYFQTNYPLLSYLVGLLTVLAIIITVGWIIERSWVKAIVKFVNDLIKKIPIIGTLYGAIQQLVGMFDDKTKSMKPVYCRFGTTLILALMPTSDIFVINGQKFHSVMIPTAPFPFGGALIMVPVEDITPSDMNIEQLCSYYGAIGVTGKDFIPIQDNSPKDSK